MQMRPDVQIQSMIKAMSDVVLPAIDPANKPAQEQSRLVIGLLALLAKQLPLQYRFDRDELQRLVVFGETLSRVSDTDASVLAARTQQAGDVLERARAEPVELEQAVRSLREASGAVIDTVFRDGSAAARSEVQRVVLEMSAVQLLRERSWFKTQGWEPNPAAVPEIETLLAPVND